MATYAWYSDKQAKVTGTKVYTTPDGGEVEATMVSKSSEDSGVYWDDIQCVGEVEHFSYDGRRPQLPGSKSKISDEFEDSFRGRMNTHMAARMHRKGSPEPTFVDADVGDLIALYEKLKDKKSPDSDADPSADIKPGGM